MSADLSGVSLIYNPGNKSIVFENPQNKLLPAKLLLASSCKTNEQARSFFGSLEKSDIAGIKLMIKATGSSVSEETREVSTLAALATEATQSVYNEIELILASPVNPSFVPPNLKGRADRELKLKEK